MASKIPVHERIDGRQVNESGAVPDRASLDEALALAMHFHQSGRLPEAERTYRAILATDPGHVDALHFLGLLRHQAGAGKEGAELIARAIALCPDYADAHSNLGNLLQAQGRWAEAAVAYRRAIALSPHAQAYNNLGVVLKDQGQLDEAQSALQQAIALAPERGDAYFNLGNVLALQGRGEEAQREYRRAIELEPTLAYAHEALARTLREMGRHAEAIEVMRQLVEKLPDSPIARHLWAAWSGRDVPSRASDDYVRQVFDGYADRFEAWLKLLEYRAPTLLAAAIAREAAASEGQWEVLDAGCGTGLCGPLLKPYARRLVGVDLSAGMLSKARHHAEYDELVQAELTGYLQGHTGRYDLIASADTLVYFGDLADILTAAAAALRSGGRLVFTVEDGGPDAADPGFRLQPHGRYHHSEDYVRRTLLKAGFASAEITREVLRKERDRPVAGLVVTACKR